MEADAKEAQQKLEKVKKGKGQGSKVGLTGVSMEEGNSFILQSNNLCTFPQINEYLN